MNSAKFHSVYFFILLFFLFLSSCEMKSHSSNGITFSNAILYNQYIVERHKELIEDVDIYNLAIEHDYNFASKTLDSIVLHATQGLLDIRHMAPYKGDSAFREVSADLFKYYSGKFIEQAKILIQLKEKMDSDKAGYEEIKILNELAKKIDAHSASLQIRVQEIQRRFARKNNFTLSK